MSSDSCSSDAESETSSADADGAVCYPSCEEEEKGELDAETETADLRPGGQTSRCCGCGAVEPDACLGRPSMAPRSAGAKVYSSGSTPCSRALASQVRVSALQTSRVHGRSTTGTPWIFARRLKATKEANETFLSWCREWISESYGVEIGALHAARTEPHIVKYNHELHAGFKGIGTHQDGSFATVVMALSEASDYRGGGTYFPHLGDTVELALGEVLLFQGQCGPYSAPHRAQPISAGRRLLYLAFFSLKTTKARPNKKKKKRRPKARSEAEGEEAKLQHTVQERGRCASARRANTRHPRRIHPVPLEILRTGAGV